MYKTLRFSVPLVLSVLIFGAVPIAFASIGPSFTGTFTTNQTTANLTAVNDQSATTVPTMPNSTGGVANDQAAVTATTVANVSAVTEVKASQTLTVVTKPGNGTNITIGSCVVSFANSTTDSDCLDNTASIDRGANAAATAASLRTLTNVSDAAHGPLTVGGSGSTASFTTSGTEASGTNINFSIGTGDITNVAVTGVIGVIGVAQINTITISGTVEAGDVFTATLPTVGAVSYTATGSEGSTDGIATGLNAAIQASAGYASQAFTSSVTGSVITLTAKVAGTGFTQTSGAANAGPTVQINTITISGTVEADDVFTATLPTVGDVSYTVQGSDTTNANIATGLNAAILASSDYASQGFTSAVVSNTVVLTAKVAGTGFIQTSSTANRTPIAQVVDFTPASPTKGETYRATINGTNYNYTVTSPSTTVADVTAALALLMDVNSAVTCADATTKITCTAEVAGTAFSYDATVVDITGPVISEVTPISSPTNDATPDYTFTTDEAGSITYDGGCSSVTSSATVGSNTITFDTLSEDTYPNCTILVTDAATNDSNTLTVSSFTVDTTAPTVAITSTTANGAYKAGANINVTLTFSEPVTSTDALTITLNTGETCSVSALTAATTGTCTSTVQAGNTSSDLTLSSIAVDNGGTIRDAAGNSANLSPTSNIADTSSIVVDTTAPIVSALSLSPSTGVVSIDGGITLTIVADDQNYANGGITINTVSATGFTDNHDNTYTATYTVSEGDTERASGNVPASVVLTDAAGNSSAAFTTIDANTTSIDSVKPQITTLTVSNAVFSPNASTDVKDTTDIDTAFDGTYDYSIRVLDSTGVLIKILQATSTAQNPQVKTWDGTDESSVQVSEGTYTVLITVKDGAGNTTADTSTSITVDNTAPVITVSGIDPETVVYGDSYTDAGATADDGSTVSTTNPVDPSTLGGYSVLYDTTDSAGNSAVQESRTVTVVSRAITVTAATDDKTYDGTTDSSATPTITSGTLASGDEDSFSQAFNTVNAGTGRVLTPSGTITNASDEDVTANYDITFVPVSTGVISQKAASIVANDTSKIYGNENPGLDAVVTGTVDDETLDYSLITAVDGTTGVGEYDITVVPGSNPNYDLSTTGSTLTINPRSLIVTADNATKTYGDTVSFVGIEFTTDDNLVNGDTASSAVLTSDGADASAAVVDSPYAIAVSSATGDGLSNYDISYVNGELTVNKADVSVSVSGDEVTYDGEPHGATSDVVTGVNLETSASYLTYYDADENALEGAPTNAGTYSVIASYEGDENHNGGSSDPATIIINKAEPSITVTPYSVTYDTEAHTATATVTGVQDEELSGLDLSDTTHTNAGDYTGEFADSWTFTDETGNYTDADGTVGNTIAKADATITIAGYTDVYDGEAHGASITTATGVGTDTDLSSSVTLGDSFTNVPGGTAHWTFSNANYNEQSGDASITINIDPDATSAVLTTTTNGDGTKSGTVANASSLPVDTSIGTVTVDLPSNLNVTGPAGWDGTLNMPSVTSSYTSPTLASDISSSVTLAIEVGSSTAALTFDKGVRLVFPGKKNSRIGWSRGGTFSEITIVCTADSQTVGDALPAGGDCEINSGSDLVVWTKHFTTFLTFTASTNGTSGGGGGGGGAIAFQSSSPISVSSVTPTPAAPVQGQVLGAAIYNFTKTLTIGSRGADVTALQQFLVDSGYAIPAGVTGYFGSQTRVAVIAFQKARGLAPVGIVGPLTRIELNKGVIATAPETTPSTSQTASAVSALTASQVDSIISLLEAFGADKEVIAQVRAELAK